MTPPNHANHIRFLTPPTLAPNPGYTHVVQVTGGRMVYLAGQVALDASGTLVGRGDFRAQAVQVFENLKAALAAAGADFNHVVKLNLFILDRANLPILREVRDQYINTATPPASTLLVVAGLASEDFLLEVEAVASLPPEQITLA
jgi:enamine deaminase RidA (YjgF/YER057c/UK114 family)